MTDAVFFIQLISGKGTFIFVIFFPFLVSPNRCFFGFLVNITNNRTGARLLIAQRHKLDMDNIWQ